MIELAIFLTSGTLLKPVFAPAGAGAGGVGSLGRSGEGSEGSGVASAEDGGGTGAGAGSLATYPLVGAIVLPERPTPTASVRVPTPVPPLEPAGEGAGNKLGEVRQSRMSSAQHCITAPNTHRL